MEIIFDFDGVLKDTNGFKIDCFKEALTKCDESKNSSAILLDVFKSLFGATREAILAETKRYIANNVAESVIREYGILVNKGYSGRADIISRNFLIYLSDIALLHVASGHPEVELKSTIEESTTFHTLFSTVNGSPLVKKQVLSRFSNLNNPVFFIGDSYQDYLSSKDFDSITFLWFNPYMVNNESNRQLSNLIPENRIITSINQLYEYFDFSPC